jgi:CheY-like chemotaxis protein
LRKPIKQSELLQAIVLALGVVRTETEHAPGADQERTVVQSLKILLVEDSYPNQVLAKGLLGKRGHSVTVANNGQEAIDLLKEQAFDLVLMDVQMPVMDGFEATRAIRQLDARDKLHRQSRTPIPILAMTAHAMKGDRERCLECGMNGYLSKPIRTTELDAALGEIFGTTKVEQNNDASAEQKTIDWPEALKSVDSDVELLKTVASSLLIEAKEQQSLLQTAIRSNDAASVNRVGHLLKGALGTLGATTCQRLAERLEMMGHQGDLADAVNCFRDFEIQMNKLTEELIAFVEGRIQPTLDGNRTASDTRSTAELSN